MRLLAVCLIAGSVVVAPPPASAADLSAPVGGPVVFRPAPGTTLLLDGRPYRGSLESRPSPAGLLVVDDLDLESYVMGLAEVPGSWPMEALKAQAVAARTYGLWERDHKSWTRSGYDVCATTTCQVYEGASQERGEQGRRWVEAVRATRAQVLVYEGRPALARYHASSGGQTLPNETVFPRDGRLPYLRAAADPADAVSPLHRWDVPFDRPTLEAILSAGFKVPAPVDGIGADPEHRTVTISAAGRDTTVSSSRFRDMVSMLAPRLFPGRYPGARPDGKPMPETLPSARFTIERSGQGWIVHGRGYGHGVGMSQWGAKGRAERGDDYRTILAAYYGGLQPRAWTGPTRIRVGLVRRPSLEISGDGAFSVLAGEDILAASTLGAWTASAAGRVVRLSPPVGFSLPLVLSGVGAPDRLTVDRSQPMAGVDVTFVLPKPAKVRARLLRRGRAVAAGGRVFEAGPGRLRVEIPHPGRLPSEDRYRLSLTAFDGSSNASKTLSLDIAVSGTRPLVPAAAAALVVILAAAAVIRRSSRGPRE